MTWRGPLPFEPLTAERVVPLDLDRPTKDFTNEPAMDEGAFLQAVATGSESVPADTDLVCLGEMGIGNTTAAAAIAARLDAARRRGLWHPRRNDVDASLRMLTKEAAP